MWEARHKTARLGKSWKGNCCTCLLDWLLGRLHTSYTLFILVFCSAPRRSSRHCTRTAIILSFTAVVDIWKNRIGPRHPDICSVIVASRNCCCPPCMQLGNSVLYCPVAYLKGGRCEAARTGEDRAWDACKCNGSAPARDVMSWG